MKYIIAIFVLLVATAIAWNSDNSKAAVGFNTGSLPTDSDVYLLRDNQLMHLDPQTGQTHLVTEFAPLSTVRSTEPDRTERRLYAADIDPAAQYLYQIEVWGRSSNRRIPNAPTGGELVRIDMVTKERQVISKNTTIFHFVLSPDGQRMILFYYDGEFLYSKPRACILDLHSFQCKDLTFDYVRTTSFWIDNDTFVISINDINTLRLVDAVTGSHTTLALPPEWHIYTAALIPQSNSILVDTHPRELVDRIPPISFLTYDLETGNVQLLPYTALDTGDYTIVNELQFSPSGDYLLYRGGNVALVDFSSGELIQEFTAVYSAGWLDEHTLLVQGSRHDDALEIMRVDATSKEVTSLLQGEAASGILLIP